MANLAKWENIIKEKRMKTPFSDYLKIFPSWAPVVLHKNKGLISRYPLTNRNKGVLAKSKYSEYSEGLLNEGLTYDFGINLFKNIQKLWVNSNLPNLIYYFTNENSDYSDQISSAKNAYLSYIVINGCENVLYSYSIKDNSKDVLNSVMVWDNSENIFMGAGIIKSSKVFYSRYIFNSSNVWFSRNLIGCSECIFCEDIENKSYCINNKELNKEEYFKKKEQILTTKKDFLNWYSLSTTSGMNLGSTDVKGNFVLYSENLHNGFFNYQTKDSRNVIFVGGVKGAENIYDVFTGGAPYGINFYGVVGAGSSENVFDSCHIISSSNIYYSYFLETCSFCIGCIGLKNKSYCILNKQYTKEEWEVLADKIFAQMDAEGILGDFFPGELNPFYFNDTMAYLIDDSFTKEEVEKDGYLWRDEKIKVDIPDAAKVITVKDLDQYQGYDTEGNWQISDDILKKVIQDERGNFYKIVPMELDFLRKHALPLPELHWLDRIKMGFKM